jgi:rod shape-determining protein MreB
MLELSSEELREAYAPVLSEIAETVRLALEQASQELYGGIRAEGILLTGEGAGLYGLERYLSEALKLPVHVAADAAECAVLGAAMMRGEKRSKIKVNPGETVTADNS